MSCLSECCSVFSCSNLFTVLSWRYMYVTCTLPRGTRMVVHVWISWRLSDKWVISLVMFLVQSVVHCMCAAERCIQLVASCLRIIGCLHVFVFAFATCQSIIIFMINLQPVSFSLVSPTPPLRRSTHSSLATNRMQPCLPLANTDRLSISVDWWIFVCHAMLHLFLFYNKLIALHLMSCCDMN